MSEKDNNISFKETVKNFFFGPEEDDYDEAEDYVSEETETVDVTEERRSRAERINSSSSSNAPQIVLERPKDFSEVEAIGDNINAKKTVLLNLELVSKSEARRILDFLYGVAHANKATIKMSATKTFIFIPHNVDFTGVDLMGELESDGFTFE